MEKQSFVPMLLLFSFHLSLNVSYASGSDSNPFTPKAYLIRYWNKQIHNHFPQPSFLLSKLSPLNGVDAAAFAKLAAKNALSSHLSSFCSAANLLCFPDLSPSLQNHDFDANFVGYAGKNFTSYGTGLLGRLDSFKNYSNDENVQADSFRRYSRDSAARKEEFANYGGHSNVVDQSFNTYGTAASSGSGIFSNYNKDLNRPNLRFNSYSAEGKGRTQSFSAYTVGANSGTESFTSYGKNGNGAPNDFARYGTDSNVIGSGFSNYDELENGANDTFTSYGVNGNTPHNTFQTYATGGNGAVDSFSNYREEANAGDDSFQSYAKNSNSAKVKFDNYGRSFNEGKDKFTGYGRGAAGHTVGFKRYGVKTTFKDYAKKGVDFQKYNESSPAATLGTSGNVVNRWVEPGKFFREAMLKKGTIMPMPDIKDKMPKRSFLPRSIWSKLPFSTSKLTEMKEIFHANDNSSIETMFLDALNDCERASSRGESKRCVGSVEDMIDFATSILGRDVAVRSTNNTNGSGQSIMVGLVNGLNGGRITKSVSCHQSLLPYMLYYCHSVPKVRVYEAEILDSSNKTPMNHGIAICHIDTSAWSVGHGAFRALGSGPGQIEVCHWIFENDMTWVIAD